MMKGCRLLDKIIEVEESKNNPSELYEFYLKKRETREEKMQACVLNYNKTRDEAK